jgi:class 3 adenylate cyclase
MSAISFLLLISGLKKARKLIKYNTHKGLRERLGDDYEIRLGLGLHIGYSIEGAIGSYHKIDASYLSSHPRMAERMEGATKHYGVPNLITEELYNYFTDETKSYCR